MILSEKEQQILKSMRAVVADYVSGYPPIGTKLTFVKTEQAEMPGATVLRFYYQDDASSYFYANELNPIEEPNEWGELELQ